MPDSPRRAAPAKLNLGLHVLARRADGFHELDTVMVAVGWHDHLAFEPGRAFRFSCSDKTLPTDDGNLVVRAARRLAEAAGIEPTGHLYLDKFLPYGAGLGGGSSDAAHTLRLLAKAWGIDLDLHPLAAELGSDVPFFLTDAPQRATGRGERLDRLDGYRLPYPLAIVAPHAHVATGSAYGLVTPRADGRPDLEAVVRSNDLDRWRRELVNDFEAPVAAAFPPVAEALALVEAAGAGYAALTGSGGAVFGVFTDDGAARGAAEAAEAAGLRAWWGYAASDESSSTSM